MQLTLVCLCVGGHHDNGGHGTKATATGTGTGSGSVTSTCESALTLSCENGHTDVVEALLAAGALPDQPDPERGFTPLMKAARAGQHCTAQCLLANHAAALDVNRASSDREHSALSLACHHGHLPVCELLLQHGANPLLPLKDNSNCLIEAAKGGHTSVVQLLIDWNYSLNMSGADAAAADAVRDG